MAVMDPMTLSPERRWQYFWEGRFWEWNRVQSSMQRARGGYTILTLTFIEYYYFKDATGSGYLQWMTTGRHRYLVTPTSHALGVFFEIDDYE